MPRKLLHIFSSYFRRKVVLFFLLMLGYVCFHGLMERSSEDNKCEDSSLQLKIFEREKALGIDERQNYRKQSIRDSCYNRSARDIIPAGSAKTGLPRHIFNHVIVNDQYRFLYCEIPKVATTNWKRVFMTLNGQAKSSWGIESRDVHNKSRRYFRYLHEYSASEIIVRLKTYVKFLFVRDPFERLVSAYRNKFVESYNLTFFEQTYGRYIIKNFRKQNLQNNKISFEEFINYILDGSPDVMNTHWQRYDELCRPCLVWYDFIGYLKNIEQDSADILKILGLENKVSFPLNISSNYQVASSVLKQKYFQKLQKNDKKRLYEKYKHDFEMFGYPKPAF